LRGLFITAWEKMREFAHREAAGEALAEKITARRYREPVIVAIPKGGVPVAAPLARRLGQEMELCLVAKVPLPWRPEAGVGALAADGTLKLNRELIHVLGLSEEVVARALGSARQVLAERRRALGELTAPASVRGKTAIVVDDGMATGYTALTAVEVIRRLEPRKIVVAAPVGSRTAQETLAQAGVEILVLTSGDGPFFDVSTYYRDFGEITDAEVRRLLGSKAHATP
jgi:predicted phosphoribosyltransferase